MASMWANLIGDRHLASVFGQHIWSTGHWKHGVHIAWRRSSLFVILDRVRSHHVGFGSHLCSRGYHSFSDLAERHIVLVIALLWMLACSRWPAIRSYDSVNTQFPNPLTSSQSASTTLGRGAGQGSHH